MVLATDTTLAIIRAKELIDSLGIDQPSEICIEDIAWYLGLSVRKEQLKGSLGSLMRIGNRGIIIVNQEQEENYKFTVAHEIGHFDLHKSTDQTAFCLSEDMMESYKHKRPAEDEANSFASELLMPEKMFSQYLRKGKPNLNLITSLASDFQTSLISTAIRYIDLTPYACAIVMSENNKIKWFRRSEYFHYSFSAGAILNSRTLAFDFLKNNIHLSDFEQIDIEAWSPSCPKNEDSPAYVNEQVISFPRLRQTMSLLWVE